MKRYLYKARRYIESSLRRQLVVYLFLWVLLPMTIVTTLLFMGARGKMKDQALAHVRQRAMVVQHELDEFLAGIANISDTFAYDVELENLIEKDYTGIDR